MFRGANSNNFEAGHPLAMGGGSSLTYKRPSAPAFTARASGASWRPASFTDCAKVFTVLVILVSMHYLTWQAWVVSCWADYRLQLTSVTVNW